MTWSGEREYGEPEVARQMLQQAPIVPIAVLPENTFGRVRGVCTPFRELDVLIAPVSGRSCFLYLVHVEAIYLDRRHVYGERRGTPFVIEEDDHRAIVDPAHGLLRIRYEHVATRYGARGATPYEQVLLRRLGVPDDPNDFRPPPRYVFQEARIESGSRVAIFGSGTREADPDADPVAMYRGEPQTRLRIAGSPRGPIAISNDPDTLG